MTYPRKLEEYYGSRRSVPAVKIFTPDKVYFIIPDATFNPHNTNKFRKVFSSGVKFVIRFSNGHFGWSDLMKSINSTQNLPIKKLVGGEVLLAGKLNGNRGGMYIRKGE